ncbi:MAG TPA: hypothetical protein VMV92_25130 [Streptosporangiaceae bacterium]|nr:hypothetical protein [Streptosporangiaceae bacterium]
MSNAVPVPAAAVRAAYHEELDEGQRSALLSWLSFTGTFGVVRGITYSIRAGRGWPAIAAGPRRSRRRRPRPAGGLPAL